MGTSVFASSKCIGGPRGAIANHVLGQDLVLGLVVRGVGGEVHAVAAAAQAVHLVRVSVLLRGELLPAVDRT